MAAAAQNAAPGAEREPIHRAPRWWVGVAWFAVLLLLPFAAALTDMGREWFTDDDMGHGLFVPIVAAYIAWTRKDSLLALRLRPAWLGLLPVAVGFLMLLAGTFGADYFIMRIGFLVSLVGVVFTVGGWPLMRELAFPLLLLVFMIRIPQVVYGQITLPLQLLATRLAEVSLSALGIPVLRNGNVLELASQQLSVVEACSGIRSLLSLCFLSLVYGYFFDSRTWMRAALLFAAVPIAIGANALRITITGVLSEIDKELAEGVYHSLEGWGIFVVSLVALFLTHRLLDFIHGSLHARKQAQPARVS